MPVFSKASRAALSSCDKRLVLIMETAIEHIDFMVLEGHRGEKAQNEYFKRGLSKVRFPNGKHNKLPSLAVDIAPWPIDWRDTERFVYFAGFIKGVAAMMGYKLRWGGDWDSDTQVKDERFRDYGHFELVD